MPRDQLLMGIAMVILGLTGFFNTSWIIGNTKTGERLTRLCGETWSTWIFRLLMLGVVLIGSLLAMNLIRPIRWAHRTPAPVPLANTVRVAICTC